MAYDLVGRTSRGNSARSHPDGRFHLLGQLPWEQRPVDLSPDGGVLIVNLRFGVLALIDLPDGDPVPLADPPGDVVAASFSPDGQRLALLYLGGSGVRIALRSVRGTDDQIILVDPRGGHSLESSVAWSPDGDALAVTWLGDGGTRSVDDDECVTTVLDIDGTPRCEPAWMTLLLPGGRTSWTRHGLSVLNQDTWQLVALAGEPAPEEDPNDGPVSRAVNGSRILSRGDGTCVVVSVDGTSRQRLETPNSDQLGDICISDLFER